ncbi:MAG: YfdX family protein, partial [Bdellovibrionota bacterium]
MNKSQTTIQSIRILSVLALGGPLAAFAQSAQTPQSSKQVAQARIEQERVKAQQDANSRAVAEALSAVQETRAAAQALDQNQTQQARAALERAVGKADLVLANHPNLALVPLSAEVQIIDTQVDDPTI